ncbi:MAG: 5'/3'-nucleotidase SurE [Deltaproteobacteria bacterium]|nr:5'/3'-nucleotidase SurE [Deltaproteobacteria bacterium]
MNILVTNDDGFMARGIKQLAGALKEVSGCRVVVVAPETEMSTTSHSLTLNRPLRCVKKGPHVYAVNGTPVDCVYMAVAAVFKGNPDLIFSGINHGANLGDDIHYSGTVAAAIEGGIRGIPSVAVSQFVVKKFNGQMAAAFAKRLLIFFKKHGLPQGLVLNVNVPESAKSFDYEITKMGKRDYGDPVVNKTDPRGRPYYWVGGSQYKFFDIKGSDCNAVVAGKISLTPLNINMTCHVGSKAMKHWRV